MVLILLQGSAAFGQSVVVGVNTEQAYWWDFPNDQALVIKGGNVWKHLILSAQYSNTIFDKKEWRIQEMGVSSQLQFWKYESLFNCFLEANFSTQVQANRKGVPVIDLIPTTESDSNWYGSRFYRSQFTQCYSLGINFFYKDFMIYGSAGMGYKILSDYVQKYPDVIYNHSGYGFKFKVGINYFIPYSKLKPKEH